MRSLFHGPAGWRHPRADGVYERFGRTTQIEPEARRRSIKTLGETGMTIDLTRLAVLAGLSIFVASGARAQPAQPGSAKPDAAEFAALERPVAFEISANTGTLKETAQRGQELIWARKDNPSDRRFQVTNISVGFLRSEAGGQVQMTFSGNTTSLGYSTPEEAKLNVIVRTKGGASLHSWTLGFSVKCGDNNQPLTPITHEVPRDLAPNLFPNVGAVEIAEYSEPNSPGLKVQRCS
jgi:hypothetical protein